MRLFIFLLLAIFAAQLFAYDDPVTFKSDVAMARVDTQVLDRDGRAVTDLRREDFVLRLDGRVVPIRNFASDNMPLDVVLLLDVSGSMQPHVERIAGASREALNVLAPQDRIAIMAFDTFARVRLPFRSDHDEVTRALNRLIRSESFNGGTRITHALLSVAKYVEENARPTARRAIVILTDDETQDEEDEPRVETALARANAVLSFLQAPYEVPTMAGGRPHGTWGSGGGGWPGIGFPGTGPIILGRRGAGGYGGMDRSHSAGTAGIARDSGGDTMRVDEASSLQETLARLRQRYSLFFYLPEGSTSADQRRVEVDLSNMARIRYEEAEIRYRRVYMAGSSADTTGPVISRVQQPAAIDSQPSAAQNDSTPKHHKIAVNEELGPVVNTIPDDSGSSAQQSAPAATAAPAQSSKMKGWPRANPQDQPQ